MFLLIHCVSLKIPASITQFGSTACGPTSATLRRKRAADNVTNQTPRENLLSDWPGRFTESEIKVKIYGESHKSEDLRGKHSGASRLY